MKYARTADGSLTYPNSSDFPNIPNWMTHDALLRSSGFLPLAGTPDEREGYLALPSRWHVVEQSEERTEPRQAFEDIVEDGDVVGQRMVMRDTAVTVDTSYIQVDEWTYEAIPAVEPPPERYSKYRIQLACQARGLWEQVKAAIAAANLQDSWSNIMDIASDNPELVAALPAIREAFGSGTVDAVLEEAVMQEQQI